jgi:hypothetical protein
MVNNKVWQSVPIDEIPEGTKIMTSAWAMKKKSNGTYRARINARGFEQVDGEHCDMDTKSSPVTCIVTIRIAMTLIVMTSWAAPAGSMLSKGDKIESEAVPLAQQAYRKGVGKLLHVTRWTRPDIMNSVRELLRFARGALLAHMKAMYRCMPYCVATSKRGIKIAPNTRWNGSPDFKFVISGQADSDYAKDLETRQSVSGIITFLCGAVITLRSKMMPMVALSVTEAELFAAVMTVQDMLFYYENRRIYGIASGVTNAIRNR